MIIVLVRRWWSGRRLVFCIVWCILVCDGVIVGLEGVLGCYELGGWYVVLFVWCGCMFVLVVCLV